jgi:hypothetical protein
MARRPVRVAQLWLQCAMLVLSLSHVASAAEPLRDKTLVAWVRLDRLDQTGSGVLSIQEGEEFDSMVFGERVPQRWMAGSHLFQRTQSEEQQQTLAVETDAQPWRKIAVVYRGTQIEIWRDASLYTSYEAPQQQTYSSSSDIYLGLRCIFAQKRHGFLVGAIDEARIYDVALDGTTIARLEPGVLSDPKPRGTSRTSCSPRHRTCVVGRRRRRNCDSFKTLAGTSRRDAGTAWT